MNIKLVLFAFLVGGLILLNEQAIVNALPALPLRARQDPNTLGTWAIVGNSGVNAMHVALVSPRKVVFIDKLEQNPLKKVDGLAAVSSEYDLDANLAKPLGIYTNTFCSTGSWLGNGTLVEVGGDKGDDKFPNYRNGAQTLRLYDVSVGDWIELEGIVPSNRWYSAMITLPSGSVMIVGGSKAPTGENKASINNPTYTIYPPPNGGPMVDVPLEFLVDTLTFNLYPMVHIIPNYEGKTILFIFANQEGIGYDLDTGTIITTYPKIPGGIRSYPLTGTSIMLPLSPEDYYNPTIMICGGNKDMEVTTPAEATCGRLELNTANAAWEMDNFGQQGRVMPDSTFLVDGSILFINGAATGHAGFRNGGGANAIWVNEDPVLYPLRYDPFAKTYEALAASTIPRMYHSVSTLIPDGTVLIAGSNPQGSVALNVKYSTEYRVEIFSPPYLFRSDPRPNIVSLQDHPINQDRIVVNYDQEVTMVVQIKSNGSLPNLRAALIHHGFITHSQNFSQRYVYLEILSFMYDATAVDQYVVTLKLPPNPTIIAPGPSYIYLFNSDSPAVTGALVLLN